MITQPEVAVHYDALLISEREMDSDPVYNWFGKHDLRYFIGCGLPDLRDHRAVFTLQRSPRQGHVQQHDIELFELIRPHVARAVTLADQLGTLRTFNRFSSALFEAITHAVFALDRNGAVLFANTNAEQLLRKNDGLRLEDRRLVPKFGSEGPRLDRLIHSALEPAGRLNSGWGVVSRTDGRTYAVFVASLFGSHDEFTAADVRALVIVHDPTAATDLDEKALCDIFDLTEAEARLAAALADGHGVGSAAASLGVQPSTVRAHLKSIFRKTGVHRQQDLVRVLASFSFTNL